jgi:hypothetical protein
MEYDGNPPFALFQFDKVQYTAILSESGDRLVIPEPVVTNYNKDGSFKDQFTVGPAHGVRISPEITSDPLSLPTASPTSHH